MDIEFVVSRIGSYLLNHESAAWLQKSPKGGSLHRSSIRIAMMCHQRTATCPCRCVNASALHPHGAHPMVGEAEFAYDHEVPILKALAGDPDLPLCLSWAVPLDKPSILAAPGP